NDCLGMPGVPICDTGTGQCVACLIDDQCPLGKVCQNKACVVGCDQNHGCGDAGTCFVDAGQCSCKQDFDCGGGSLICCNGVCVAKDNDKKNCGGCSVACISQTCCSGKCADLTNDSSNCGSCGKSCANPPNANGTGCVASKCTFNCKAGFGDCNNLPGDG